MPHLFFVYSTMNSGKSLDILKVAHNYEEQEKKVLLFTSEKDTRNFTADAKSAKGKIVTRVGLERPAWLIERVDLYKLVERELPDCILIDECQFLSEEIVLRLVTVVDKFDVPVMCYGLKNDFQNNLFIGSVALLRFADKIRELQTVCYKCNRKATMNLRLDGGKPMFHGEQIKVGGNESYLPVCRKCYLGLKEEFDERIYQES